MTTGTLITILPADDDILFSRWKTPVSAAYFKPSVQQLSAHVFVHRGRHLKCVFFFSSPKEANVNWNLLTLWDISSLRKSRWMTGTPVGPLLGPVIAPLPVGEWAETWKGSSGAGGAFLANWVSHESFEGSRALLAGAERRQKTDFIFPTALSSTEYFPLLLYLSSNR